MSIVSKPFGKARSELSFWISISIHLRHREGGGVWRSACTQSESGQSLGRSRDRQTDGERDRDGGEETQRDMAERYVCAVLCLWIALI